ncbi:response regulator [Pseudogemmobacter humi]|uniref:Sensory/regulatory protein RpfC n=1 Tax=Pseudogemmobacter humi TaxID=2483812 RepID=A0A3P5WUC0_9RHOB|nr:response regulator [Pseudogemmobacter humi]VDC25188.1 Signal transduction histidine-protein kinase BarA [Pseudogemmobacter humi]
MRTALIAILIVALLPTLGVVAMALINAGKSFRELSEQRLLETASILAQSTASEIEVTGRLLHGLQAGLGQPGAPLTGPHATDASRHDLFSLVRNEAGAFAPPPGVEPALAGLVVQAAGTGRMQVSNFLPERYPGDTPRIAIAHPAAEGGGAVTVAVVVGHPGNLIRSLARQTKSSGAAVLAITDGEGRIIARSVGGERLTGQPVPDWPVLAALGTGSGSFRARTIEGRAIVFSFQRIAGTPGWVALVGEPVVSFDLRWQNPIRSMIIASSATIAVALLFALLLARRVLAPIRGLVERSRQIAALQGRGGVHDAVAVPPAMIAEFETLRRSLDQAERELRARLTESRAAEETARESLRALEWAERLARIGSWTYDPARSSLSASAMMSEMNGADPGREITLEDLRRMMPPEDFARVGEANRRCLETGEPYTVDIAHYRPSGGSFSAEVRGQAIRGADGRIAAISGTVQDVSEREEARAQLGAIVDSLPNGAIYRIDYLAPGIGLDGNEITTEEMRVSYVSAGVERLVGYPAEAIMENPGLLMRAVHPDDRERYLAASRQATLDQTNFECDFRVVRPDGSLRWLQIRSAPRALGCGRVWDGIILDVTQAYETAEALRIAKENAEAAERAKADFLATMSHEIRTPMNSVIGMTRLALQTEPDPRQRNYLEKINDSANVLLGIITDILDYSRIEAGGMTLESAVFRLESVLETVSSVTALRAEEKGLELTFDIASGVCGLWRGDSLRLAQVLTNLVGNAVKFTEKGDVVVSVSVQPGGAGEGERLLFAVRDTGIGMTGAQIAGLFRPFSQAGADTARKYGGTGLGLAISRRIVELMGGRIWVESTPGLGSTFFFTAELDRAGPEPASRISEGLKDRRVLIVDDNEAARKMLADMVTGFGMRALTASGGEEALYLLHGAEAGGQPFDIVLSDWRMPGMDGLELARRIREDARLLNLPAVLMVTAYGQQLVLSEAGDIRLQGVVLKPVTRSMVFSTLSGVLAVAPGAGARMPLRRIGGDGDLIRALAGRRVLVVDDNALNREVAREFLELAGMLVVTASDGREAILRMEEAAFGVVLMDVHMPGMNGLEAIREIRRRPEWASLPVIALTARARVEDQRESLAAGMTAHLTKPLDEQALYRLLAELVGQGAAPPAYTPDLPQLLRRFGGSRERLLRFVDGFLRDFGDMEARFAALMAGGDLAKIADFAHRVRGVVGYLEADAMFALSGHVEEAARRGDGARVEALAPGLRRLMAECLAHLHRFRADMAPPEGGGPEGEAAGRI